MRVKIDSGGGGAIVWLAGEPGVGNRTFTEVNEMHAAGRPLPQPAEFLRAAYRSVFNRGNKGEDITFSSERTYETVADAERYYLEQWTRIPGRGLVTFQVLSGGSVSIERWLNGAVIEGVDRTYAGVKVSYTYHIIGGQMLDTAPTEILS